MTDIPTPYCFHDNCPGCANPGYAEHMCPDCCQCVNQFGGPCDAGHVHE